MYFTDPGFPSRFPKKFTFDFVGAYLPFQSSPTSHCIVLIAFTSNITFVDCYFHVSLLNSSFQFSDYTEVQLTKILYEMAAERNYHFESKKKCGVPIARVLARRMHTKGDISFCSLPPLLASAARLYRF
jgi:hypothetical protein